MADPFTWAGAAAILGEAVLAWGGTKIMESIFGNHGADATKLQEESIRKLTDVFRQVLREERLKEALDSLESLINNVTEYNNAPSSSFFRLQNATTDSLKLLATLAGLDYLGLPSYLVAANLRITILQELCLVSGNNDELRNILALIKRSIEEGDDALVKGRDMFNSLVSAPRKVPITFGEEWKAGFNGEVFRSSSQAGVYLKLNEAKNAFKKKEMDPIQESYDKVRNNWFGLREVTVGRAKAADIGISPDLLNGTSFQSFIIQTGTALHETDHTFQFDIANWNGDNRPDLVAIKKRNTGTKSTEVHILSGASNFQSFLLQTGTVLHETDDSFQFIVTDWNGDGRPDLVAIKKRNTGTKSTEVHVLSGASNFQSFLLQTGTGLHETDDSFQFVVADWNGDGRPDLVAIKKRNTGTGTTEVHILSGASNFQSFILQTGTSLPETNDNWQFTMTDWNGDGRPDLVAIKKIMLGATSTEVYILSGSSIFQSYLMKTGTALHPTDEFFEFLMVDWSKDGRPDLFALSKRNTGTKSTEVHCLAG